jgi:hypothetical protein
MELLLQPLLLAAKSAGPQLRARVLLLGDLHPAESAQLSNWQRRFAEADWQLQHERSLPQEIYFRRLSEQHGLLLLSASMGALPSKLFEYLALGRPILAVAPPGSAVWKEAERCPAIVRLAIDGSDLAPLQTFLHRALELQERYELPTHLAESGLRSEFLRSVRPWLGQV